MKYSIEVGKIVEGALKRDQVKVINYCEQLVSKLELDGEARTAEKFKKILESKKIETMSPLKGYSSSIPVDSESRVSLADIIYPSDNTVETILRSDNERQIKEFIQNYQNADKLQSVGLKITNTLLLYGPPGTGKTNTALMIAKKLNLPIVIARLDSLISSYLGTTAKNIRMLFEFVEKLPCLLLLDEFDAIAKARDDSNELGELKRVVNSLLQNIDSIGKESLIIASTNHEQLLDSAVWRRFNYQIEIGLPDVESIVRMIPLFIKGKVVFDEKELLELAICLEGLSGSDIEEILHKAQRTAIIKGDVFSINYIFEEIFMRENISGTSSDSKHQQAKYLKTKNRNRKIFTLDSIGEIVGLSKGHLSTILKEDNDE